MANYIVPLLAHELRATFEHNALASVAIVMHAFERRNGWSEG